MRNMRATVEALVRREARLPPGESDALVASKVDGFFWPMFQWIEEVVGRAKGSSDRAQSKPCVCVGLSCVQGGGKTTTTKILRELLQTAGRKCAVVSLDDVYLTRKEQIDVAAKNASNPLLQHRGNPGTHDLSLLLRLVEESQRSGESIAVPQFDKSLHDGRGDRVPRCDWEKIEGPLDVLLIEGWCLGFRSLNSAENLDPNLAPVNEALRGFEELYRALDAMVVIKVETPQWVYRWREEQETHLRNAGKPALTSEQVRDFVDRFMPAYSAYLPGLYELPPSALTASGQCAASHLDTIPTLHVEIDITRSPCATSSPVEANIQSATVRSLRAGGAQ